MYAENNICREYGITVPLPGGGKAAISHKSITHAEKTIGAMTSLDGACIASIRMMQDKAQQWINDVRGGHLNRRNVWFLLKVQFWPQVGYGLCSSMASFQDLERVLHKQYYQILPLGGTVRTTPVESRTIDTDFFWNSSPAPRRQSINCHDQQASDALWMQNGDRITNKNFLLIVFCRTWPFLHPIAGVI